MPVGTAVANYASRVPMLLKADGSNYDGVTYVRQLLHPYERRFPEITQLANNDEAWANVGNSQEYIDGFTVECWTVGAMQGVKNDIANPANEGKFILEIPPKGTSGSVVRHTIRFFEATFAPTYLRREGFPDVFTADIENIKVLD